MSNSQKILLSEVGKPQCLFLCWPSSLAAARPAVSAAHPSMGSNGYDDTFGCRTSTYNGFSSDFHEGSYREELDGFSPMTSPRPQGAGSDLASPASQSPRSLRTSPRPVSELYGSPRADESPALKEGSLGSPWGRSGAHGEEGGRRSFVVSVVPGTPPGLLRDWVFFAFNNHVLLSVFLAHPSHPYNAERRRLVLLNSLGFAFFVASLFFLAGHALPSVPHDWPTTLKLLSLLADQPTTLSVLVQLAWDASGSSLGVCPCAQLCCRRPCGFAMVRPR